MATDSPYDRLVTVSPHAEMLARRVYRLARPALARLAAGRRRRGGGGTGGGSGEAGARGDVPPAPPASFDALLERLVAHGSRPGDVMVVHGAFSALRGYALAPEAVVARLLEHLGPDGTLAMPAIPIYPNETAKAPLATSELLAQRYVYKPNSTRIWTGALAKALLRHPDARRSRHPLNSMVAVGARAEAMMASNLDDPYPCGVGSAWHFAYRHDAFVVGLGTDLTHSLTMIHVAEDRAPERWPVAGWYQDRVFRIREADGEHEARVRERAYRWGQLHFAERNLARDLERAAVLRSERVDGVLLESLRAAALIDYLDRRNVATPGYPYYWLGKARR